MVKGVWEHYQPYLYGEKFKKTAGLHLKFGNNKYDKDKTGD